MAASRVCRFGFPILFGLMGCNPDVIVKDGAVKSSDLQLQMLGQIYARTQQQLRRPPRSFEELKPFVLDGVDFNAIKVSPNDGEPFVVAWGADFLHATHPQMVVMYESIGVGGMRHVLTPSGVVLMNDVTFAQAVFPPGHQPKKK